MRKIKTLKKNYEFQNVLSKGKFYVGKQITIYISTNKLASLSYITQSTAQHLTDGRSKNPKILTIARISNGFGLKLKDFFDDPVFDDIDLED